MHEFALMKDVIKSVMNHLKDNPLEKNESPKILTLTVGALDIHSEESFKQAFEAIAKETPLKDCKLNLKIKPGNLSCDKCGFKGQCPIEEGDGHDSNPITNCPKCGEVVKIQDGRGIEAEITT